MIVDPSDSQLPNKERDSKYGWDMRVSVSKEKELKKCENSDNGIQRTRKDYDKDLIFLSKFQGYRLDSKIITLAEYGNVYSLYVQWYEKQEKEGTK